VIEVEPRRGLTHKDQSFIYRNLEIGQVFVEPNAKLNNHLSIKRKCTISQIEESNTKRKPYSLDKEESKVVGVFKGFVFFLAKKF